MTEFLTKKAPNEIGGQKVEEVSQRDGVKYIMADDSWLLIRHLAQNPSCACMSKVEARKWSKLSWRMGRQWQRVWFKRR